MRINNIQITDYRSVSEASLPLADVTVLLGKNNEGKSNVLMAVNIAISTLQEFAEMKRRRPFARSYQAEKYVWTRDYPILKQKTKRGEKKTTFVLEFSLDKSEIKEFRAKIGNRLNGVLPIMVAIGKDNKATIKVVKQGRGSENLNKKSQEIAKYISGHIEFNYIPAVRTVDDTVQLINNLISKRLQDEQENDEYKEAMNKIEAMENRVRDKLAIEIKEYLQEFMPNVREVKLDMDRMDYVRREVALKINDGQETDLKSKGDGVKSIVAMSLLKNRKLIPNSASVIAIEEPESHLHPSAIDTLRKAIMALSAKSQIIISTHSPQFVNRNDLGSNIIVDSGNAMKALNIRQIRDVLGVKLSDNLYGARLILYVEGPSDAMVLVPLFREKSDTLRNAINNNELIIQPMCGTDHLEMHVSTAKTMLADFFVLLDNDSAGSSAAQRMLDKGMMSQKDYMLTAYQDMHKQAEMEDMLDCQIYKSLIMEKYDVDISAGAFKARNIKWSERMENIFKAQGKVFNDAILADIKFLVAQQAANGPLKALRPEGEFLIKALVEKLEKKLGKGSSIRSAL